jgi:hypothetical protein
MWWLNMALTQFGEAEKQQTSERGVVVVSILSEKHPTISNDIIFNPDEFTKY